MTGPACLEVGEFCRAKWSNKPREGTERGGGRGRYITKMPEKTNGMYELLWSYTRELVHFREIQKTVFVVKADEEIDEAKKTPPKPRL